MHEKQNCNQIKNALFGYMNGKPIKTNHLIATWIFMKKIIILSCNGNVYRINKTIISLVQHKL